jgi:ubiquinone/menaquinone biosynthesis C-methylase UbiE
VYFYTFIFNSTPLHQFVDMYCELPRVFRKPLWRMWHRLLNKFDNQYETIFLNYGYAETRSRRKRPVLETMDEINRYCIQLYHHVANQINLANLEVIEVGCGRGGGASYITRYLKPKSYTGIDISKKVIDFCNRFHRIRGLQFITGDAENIPLENNSADAVVNIESARCYGNISKFFEEVHRILRPDGHFLFADVVRKHEMNKLKKKLSRAGFNIIRENNITDNVARSLELDHERRYRLIRKLVPRFFYSGFREFAGLKESARYRSLASGSMEYWSFYLTK